MAALPSVSSRPNTRASTNKPRVFQSTIIPIFVRDDTSGKLFPKPFLLGDVTQSLVDVCEKLRETYGFSAGYLSFNGKRMSEFNHSTDCPAYYHLDSKFWLFNGMSGNGSLGVWIRELNGKAHRVFVESSDTIDKLSHVIDFITGFGPYEQRLIFAGRQLEPGRTLADYNIPKDSTVHMILRLRGGGPGDPIMFADLESSRDISFSKEAPKWRRATPGLCLEGPCTNKDCDAFKQIVVCNKGMREFSLAIDGDRVRCPLCSEKVVPVTTAFNNCQFYYFGVYRIPTADAGLVHKQSPPQLVGNVYKRFNEFRADGTSAVVAWEFLKIVTVDPKEKIGFICRDTECPVCLCTLSDQESRTAACGHRYHSVCFDLLKQCKPACPQCEGKL